MKKKWLLFAVVLFFLAGSGIGIYFGTPSIPKNETEKTVPVQSVAAITGYAEKSAVRSSFLGVLSSEDAVVIRLDSGRESEGFLVGVGDHVDAGEILAIYDNSGLILECEQFRLEIEQLKLTLDSLYLQIRTLQKDREQADAEGRADYDLQILNVKSQAEQCEYDIGSKEREIERLEVQIAADQVLSPCSGLVTDLDENEKSLSIISQGIYELTFSVSEEELEKFHTGADVTVTDRAGKTFVRGTVTRIESGNPKDGETETGAYKASVYPVHAVLEGAEDFIPGQHVYVCLTETVGQEEAKDRVILLPEGYVNGEEKSPWVWAADPEGKLEKRTIRLGSYNDRHNSYEVAEGISMTDYLAWPSASIREGIPADFGE